jgi:excisionase family DNA binding protein
MKDVCTARDVADNLGISLRRVHKLIEDGRLPAEKFGSQYVIKKADIELVRERKPGRPPKAQTKN